MLTGKYLASAYRNRMMSLRTLKLIKGVHMLDLPSPHTLQVFSEQNFGKAELQKKREGMGTL